MRILQVLVKEPIAAMQFLPMRMSQNSQPMSGTSGLHPQARPKVQTSRERIMLNT